MKVCEFRNCNEIVKTKTPFCSSNCRNRELVKRRGEELKRMALIYRGGACAICFYDLCHEAIDFHHVDPTEKDFQISGRKTGHSWEVLRVELEKCIPLCANCHREHHAGLISEETMLLKLEEINSLDIKNPEELVAQYVDCKSCGKKTGKRGGYCGKCKYQYVEKIEWPTDEDLIEMVSKSPMTTLSKELGVSPAAITKRMKVRGLEFSRFDYRINQNKKAEIKKLERQLALKEAKAKIKSEKEMALKERVCNQCIDCKSSIAFGSTRCVPCNDISKITTPYPPLEELIELVKTLPMNKVGEMFNVSGNAVKKHLKRNGVELPKYYTQNIINKNKSA